MLNLLICHVYILTVFNQGTLVYPSDQKGEGGTAGNLAFPHLEFRIISSGKWI